MPQSRRGLPFIALAIAFLALGIGGNRMFLTLAAVFFALAVVFMQRPPR